MIIVAAILGFVVGFSFGVCATVKLARSQGPSFSAEVAERLEAQRQNAGLN